MKKYTVILFTLMSLGLFTSQAMAATSEVKWTNPEKYRDIDPGDENRKSFHERTFKNFEKHFTKLAERLPDNYVWKVEVTDVDLAGDTHAAGIHRMRIVKEIYFPRLNFSYQLVDENGKTVKEDIVSIKDMNFMHGSNLKYRNKSLGYEKKMLDDWFFKAFEDIIVEKK